MDSGIKVEKSTLEKMGSMKEIKKCPFDLLIMDIEKIPGSTGTATKSAPEHVVVVKEWATGECEKELEGIDTGDLPANFYVFREYCLKELPDKCCMALMYFRYKNKEQSVQEKLLAVNWVSENSPMKLKMRYSTSFKNMCTKAPNVNNKLEAHDADVLTYKHLTDEVFKK